MSTKRQDKKLESADIWCLLRALCKFRREAKANKDPRFSFQAVLPAREVFLLLEHIEALNDENAKLKAALKG